MASCITGGCWGAASHRIWDFLLQHHCCWQDPGKEQVSSAERSWVEAAWFASTGGGFTLPVALALPRGHGTPGAHLCFGVSSRNKSWKGSTGIQGSTMSQPWPPSPCHPDSCHHGATCPEVSPRRLLPFLALSQTSLNAGTGLSNFHFPFVTELLLGFPVSQPQSETGGCHLRGQGESLSLPTSPDGI